MQIERAFKEISKTVFWKMQRNDSVEETSLTDEVIDQLRQLNSERLLAIKGINEKKNGADIEWWIVFPGNSSHNLEAIHMRIQAKRLHLRDKVDHRYKDLDHKKGKQLKNLIKEAFNIKAIPLYCFYNYYSQTPYSFKKNPVDIDDGWRYAYAADISKARRTSFSTYDHLSTIDPLTKPVHWLAMLAEKNPRDILAEYAKQDGSITLSNLVKDKLPDYVFDILDSYLYLNGDFFKDKQWFPQIKEVRRKHKEEKGKRAVSAMIKQMLNNFMTLISFEKIKKKQRHLIITIAEEPMNLD
ncbi:DUF6615 family protein [Priestia aryabhattai]|uniref:DUF6615 family protein n=1 Tax=Priestia aryabhattai TaxID=412384 RepID=UPI003D2AF42A